MLICSQYSLKCQGDLTYSLVRAILKKILDYHTILDLVLIGLELSCSITVTSLV